MALQTKYTEAAQTMVLVVEGSGTGPHVLTGSPTMQCHCEVLYLCSFDRRQPSGLTSVLNQDPAAHHRPVNPGCKPRFNSADGKLRLYTEESRPRRDAWELLVGLLLFMAVTLVGLCADTVETRLSKWKVKT